MDFSFADTHAYPGRRVRVRDAAMTAGATAMVEFSDGAVANGTVEGFSADEITLAVAPYVTGRGTRIQGKTWILRLDLKTRGWTVARKAPAL